MAVQSIRMLERTLILLCLMALGCPSASIAQEQAPRKPQTNAGALRFIQEILTRGPAKVKPWPGFAQPAAIANLTVKGNCRVSLALTNKGVLVINLDRVLSVKPLLSSNAPQSSVEIRGGVQPYEGIDIFVGDNDAVSRVSNALNFLRQACDTSSDTGF